MARLPINQEGIQLRDQIGHQHRMRRILTASDMMGFLLAVLLARLITAGVNSFGELRNLVEAFLPFILIWLVVAPFVGLFRPTIALEIDQLWRVGALVPICVLVAYWLGSLWNEQPLTTVFAIAMTLISTPLLVGLRYLVIRLGSGKV